MIEWEGAGVLPDPEARRPAFHPRGFPARGMAGEIALQ
jgi:hypothetical protein